MWRYPACTIQLKNRLHTDSPTFSNKETATRAGSEKRGIAVRETDLDGGVDGLADDAGVGLPSAEPHRGDLGAVVEQEVPRHLSLSEAARTGRGRGRNGNGEQRVVRAALKAASAVGEAASSRHGAAWPATGEYLSHCRPREVENPFFVHIVETQNQIR
jgi:hypothetical protein